MHSRKRARTAASMTPTRELEDYFAGRNRPSPRDIVPLTFQTLADSMDAARVAMLAPFPDLTERPQSEVDARAMVEKCVNWATEAARAFNADALTGQPYGLQTSFQMPAGGQWARDFLGALPNHLAFQLKLEPYRWYIKRSLGEPRWAAAQRKDLLGYWSSVCRSLYWQYRSDRAACRRLIEWVTRSLDGFGDEELPRITYVKLLGNRLHQISVTLCGVVTHVELQDNLVLLLRRLETCKPVEFEHRTFKQRLIELIPALANCISPAQPEPGHTAAVTGAMYQLDRVLLGRVDMKGYA